MLSSIYKKLFHKIERPLGRWGLVEKPYLEVMYDNCYGQISKQDQLEYETYTQGCVFIGEDIPYCSKCFTFLPNDSKSSDYIVGNRLHKSLCKQKK